MTLRATEALVALVDGLVHDPHAAAADPLQDPVVGDPLDGAGQGPRHRPVPAAAGRRKMLAGSPLARSIFEAKARKTPSPRDLPHDDAHVRDLREVEAEDVRKSSSEK